MKIIFWSSIFLIFFTYCGYPITLYLIGLSKRKVYPKTITLPRLTLIISAYNEEQRIDEKLQNTISLDYPSDKFEIIVVSDGSTDRTNQIVQKYEKHNVKLLALQARNGKEFAQREAVKQARGDVLVFTDVATRLDLDGIKKIIINFSNPSIGCVSSEDRLIDLEGKPVGEGLYVKYEMWLRRLESKANSLIGLSGSFFAARREVCKDFSPDMQSDFRTVLNSAKLGLRGISDPNAIGYYLNLSDEKQEFDRKVRTVLRGINVFLRHLELLNFFRYGLFSYQLFCHKLCRWLVPVFLLGAFFSNIILAFTFKFYFILFIFHAIFYAIAVCSALKKTPPSSIILKIPMYFINVNVAIVVAWWRYLMGKRVVMWEPSKR